MTEAARETVIIVHGTWAAPTPGVVRWYQPGEGARAPGEFVSKLDEALRKRGSPARCWAHCTEGDEIFHWSGDNNWIMRTRAASALADYVVKLRNEGWRCHLVAHSHGGNVALEALPQITTALHPEVPYGQIVTLGTPFMDTVSLILKRTTWTRKIVTWLSWMGYSFFVAVFAVVILAFVLTGYEPVFFKAYILTMTVWLLLPIPFLLYRRLFRKSLGINDARLKPQLLAVGSVKDEPWQILYHMQNTDNPMAVRSNLIIYLLASLRAHISRSVQIARIYGAKSYRDLALSQKCLLAFVHFMVAYNFGFAFQVPLRTTQETAAALRLVSVAKRAD
jgi:hypothetical protein